MPEPTHDMSARGSESFDIPFFLRGTHGYVHVEVTQTQLGIPVGHEIVASDWNRERMFDFPVAIATVDYLAFGLKAMMGWIQTIRHFDALDAEDDFSVDRFPLGPDDSPLYTYGYLPTFFDAPANPDHPDGVWQADTWLIAIPDIIRTRRVFSLAGFRWGYRLIGGRPKRLVTRRIGWDDWLRLIPRLSTECPRWEFLDHPPQ